MIGQLFASVLPLVLFANLINVGEMVRGGINSLSMTNGGGPPIQPNPSINLVTNAAHSLNSLRLNPSTKRNQQHQSTKTANKKGVKIGSKVKLQQKLKSGVKSKALGEKKSKLGMAMFYVFMLFSVFVPQQNMPNNVMIHYNNQFVPIEQQYLSCQPSTSPLGQKCEFLVEQMAMNNDMPKVSIWANLDGANETIQKLGETDIRPCEVDNDGHSSYCETELEIKPNEIDTLPKMLISNVEKYKYNLLNNGTKVAAPRGGGRKLAQMGANDAGCGSGQVKFTYINGCPYKLWLYRTSLEHPQATVTPLESGTVAEECVPNVLTSGRVVPNTDCDKKDCNPLGVPPISLFEMTFTPDQFFDASYVDGVNVPIGVRFQNCDENGDKTITFNNQLTKLDSLTQKLPADMFVKDEYQKTQIKSLCGTYNSDDVCCRAAYGTPDTCQPTNWAPEKQAIYNALRAANPDGYTYAYDDKTAIKKCSSDSVAILGFCTNV
ncbi:hypothetical protein niasHT_036689 [Heterodera trifolii]|uniref:Uncharacterized protein n=1 Tax=Heterodera trifolii TaxID=157864 RepID=A0ABD2HZI8_9BILA